MLHLAVLSNLPRVRGALAVPRVRGDLDSPLRRQDRSQSVMTASPRIPVSFFLALNLRERAALPPDEHEGAGEAEAELGERRLERHRDQPGLREPGEYERRLAALGLDAAQARALLSASAASLARRAERAPSWAEVIVAAYGGAEPVALEGDTLAAVATPLVAHAKKALGAAAAELAANQPQAPFEVETVAAVLLSKLGDELATMLERTLVLELHVARLEGRLTGQTGGERFASYLHALSRPGAMMALFEEYPVLARVLGTHTEQAIAAGSELLRRLTADWPRLVEALGLPPRPGALTTALAAGDRHDDGRAVVMLRWASGAELVYKPKPLAADRRFQALLGWLNDRGATPPLRPLIIVDRGVYGYCEVVGPRGCTSEQEVERFFVRQGALLGLFYGLLATDFHCENVIAAGEHPYPIDLESLFHAQITDTQVAGVDALTEADLVFSVLRVGLLPERANENNGAPGLDLSGLGGQEGQLSAVPRPTWADAGTDRMQLVRERLPLMGSANRPTLGGAPVEAFDWTEAIVRGLTGMYELLEREREALVAEPGPLAAFADDVVRVIARPTRVYASLLAESYHPDLLRDAVDRDVYFDRLWSIAPGRRHLCPLVALELHDLWRGDIPKLTARAGRRALEHTTGRRADFFAASGLELAREHLGRLGPRDLAHQRWIVRAAMVAVATDVRAGRWARYRPEPHPRPLGSAELVAAAEGIAARLADTALQTSAEATWLGLAFTGGHWVLAPLGTDLYGGLLGVALFLAHAAEITGQERYRELAERAVRTLCRKEREAGEAETSIGGYSGLGALVYGLTQLARLWGRDDLLALAGRQVPRFGPRIEQDEALDVLSGSSGAIGGLLAYHEVTGDAGALEAATRCAERLVARAVPIGEGVGWPSEETGGRALAGFSHGAAGMAWALVRMAELTGDARYRRTALAAIRYERTLFVPDEGNYYDLRPELLAGKDAQFSLAWCHGAPGVGLARAAQLPLLDARARQEVRITAEVTARALGRGHSLCHGDLGNLELVHRAAEVLEDPELGRRAEAGVSAVVEHATRERWLCGVPLAVETPGLMVGLAGMGYQLLRFAHPGRVPSVLLLESVGQAAVARARDERSGSSMTRRAG